jgi:hypothetical protein
MSLQSSGQLPLGIAHFACVRSNRRSRSLVNQLIRELDDSMTTLKAMELQDRGWKAAPTEVFQCGRILPLPSLFSDL